MDVQADTPRTSAEPKASASDGGGSVEQIPGGRYHIVERLSTGAIGAVYKALDTVLDRPVAVKSVRLDTPFADQTPDELRERFVREARIAARLQHQNIVTIHDIVATPDRGYIIMEFIEGRTLESLIESEERLPLSAATRIVSQLASALDYAHERNVIHRDVKPSNILVSPSLYVWVTDFGIAKSELSTNLTMAGGVLGTPDYMSPEQAKGEDVDSRSDLFSLGCILFECVVGEKPFRSPSLTGVLLSIINDEPFFPLNWRSLGLPMELKPILHHALEKERDKRFTTGAELVKALETLPGDAVVKADVAAGAPEPVAEAQAPGIEHESKAPGASEPVPEPEASEADAVEPVPSQGDEHISSEEVPAPTAEAKAEEPQEPETPSEELPQSEETHEELPQPGDTHEELPQPQLAAERPAAEEMAEPAEPKASGDETPAAEQAEAEAKTEPEAEAHTEPEAAKVESEDAEEVGAEAESDAPQESTVEEEAPVEAVAEPEPEKEEPTENGPEVTPKKIRGLKEESQVLHLSPTLSADLQGVEITPEEGFLLSRIDGASRPNDIMSVSPMAEGETARALLLLLEKKLIRLGGVTTEGSAPETKPKAQPQPTKKAASQPNAEVAAEVDRLLGLARDKAYPALLGLSSDAPEAKRKSAYLKIVAKYHPDRFPTADGDFRSKLSSLCAAVSEAVTDFEQAVKANDEPKPATVSTRPTNGHAPAPPIRDASSDVFDKRRYARELYDRALTAFDKADYWDAIQLGRQAVEADEQQHEFYGLLGRALLQNKKWRKEAADNFLKASELEPGNIEYIGLLGAIYQNEGLTTRANAMLKRARAIDPEYEFPPIDGEAEVTTD